MTKHNPLLNIEDETFMRRALELADFAFAHGEIPVGAVVVYDGKIIGEGSNQPIASLDPSAHAEVVAIRQAAKTIGNYRLNDCTLYVTIEPCTMCVGLCVHSRIGRLVYGAPEQKAGAISSATKIEHQAHFNHCFDITSGILEVESAEKISLFFKQRRAKKKQLKQRSSFLKDA